MAGLERALTALDLCRLTAPTDLPPEDLRLLTELCAGHRIHATVNLIQLTRGNSAAGFCPGCTVVPKFRCTIGLAAQL